MESCLCAGDTGLEKDANLRRLISTAALAQPVYVGDTRSDERAARGANCAFIHAAYGFGDAERPDAVLNAFAQLPSLLENLEETE